MTTTHSTSSTDAPAAACSPRPAASPLSNAACGPVLWFTLSGTPKPRPLAWAWTRRPVTRRLSGLTCPHLTAQRGVDSVISRLRGCRALPSRRPESVRETRTLARGVLRSILAAVTHGGLNPIGCGYWQRLTLDWCSLKTFQPGLLAGISPSSQSRYTDWVTLCRTRSTSLRKTLAHLTNGSASSCWESWPTADANTSTYSNGLMGENLREACTHWPTAQERDYKGGDQKAQHGVDGNSLPNAAQNWASPNTCQRGPETAESKSRRAKTGAIDLQTQAMQWATPQKHDTNPRGAGNRKNPLGGNACLGCDAKEFPSTPRGETTSALGLLLQVWTRPECPRLNPVMQWWLMGWPHPTLLFSESAATEWTRWRQQLQSIFCSLARALESER